MSLLGESVQPTVIRCCASPILSTPPESWECPLEERREDFVSHPCLYSSVLLQTFSGASWPMRAYVLGWLCNGERPCSWPIAPAPSPVFAPSEIRASDPACADDTASCCRFGCGETPASVLSVTWGQESSLARAAVSGVVATALLPGCSRWELLLPFKDPDAPSLVYLPPGQCSVGLATVRDSGHLTCSQRRD
jgi:hypothetical protein